MLCDGETEQCGKRHILDLIYMQLTRHKSTLAPQRPRVKPDEALVPVFSHIVVRRWLAFDAQVAANGVTAPICKCLSTAESIPPWRDADPTGPSRKENRPRPGRPAPTGREMQEGNPE